MNTGNQVVTATQRVNSRIERLEQTEQRSLGSLSSY